MKGKHIAWPILLGLAAATSMGGNLAAGDLYNKKQVKSEVVALPTPAEVKTLAVFPETVTLNGTDDSRQLLLTASLLGNRQQDLTGDCQYKAEPAGVVRVTTAGRVIPIANGKAKITARFGDKTAQVEVVSAHCDEVLPINFTNHIVPIFTKLGCNSGGCHGKSGGQNGFALSLLGFVPEMDYAALVKEDRGRRLFPAAPEHSLLLTKASGGVAHAGGKRMEVGSDEYKMILRWIASGTPVGKDTDPRVTSISVEPASRVLPRNNKQQVAILAHYSDGTVSDVTQRAQYESNDSEIAAVDGAGLVRSLQMSGEAAIMARYQGQVTVFRATVPLGMKTPPYEFPAQTVVDRFTNKKWQELGIVPSELCSDEQFLRRVSVAITGTLPTPAQVRAYLNDADPRKRDKLVDDLLETPEYAYFFANKWADVLKVKRKGQPQRAAGTFGFHNWIRESIAQDKPYDRFAREIIAASGTQAQSPPTLWHTELQNPQEYVDDTAQVFLGQRLACAQCHHHPYEKWSQDDYWGLAAFFGRIGRKQVQELGGFQNQQAQQTIVYNKSNGTVINKRTSRPADIKALDGPPMKIDAEDDPRQKLVDWMVDAKNPFFARAVANRYWAHFFGRGLVDPLDDMRVTNPPSNPELLDALAKELVDSKYSLKHLIKVIVRSRTYQLSSVPNAFNKHDKQAFARYYPQRMSAEVLYDAVNQVTNAPANFGGLPQDKLAPRRAIMLPDEAFPSYFLDVFGRPQRISACECERVSEANLAQALHLLNSDEIQTKLARQGSRAEMLVKDPRPDVEKVEEIFLWAFARRPSADHLQLALAHINRHAQNKRIAYENILWALINTKEFQFSQ